MTTSNPMMGTSASDMDLAGLNAPGDGLIASLAQSMAQLYFPEMFEQKENAASMEDCPECGKEQGDRAGLYDAGVQDVPEPPIERFPPPGAPSSAPYSPLMPGSFPPCLDNIPPMVFSPLCVPEISKPQPSYDVHTIREDFPILKERVRGKDLVWLDNAATTQKPKCVIERLAYFYEHENSNVHRGAHDLAARATDAYEDARAKAAAFIHAAGPEEIVFVRGTTEGINLVAQSFGLNNIGEGDEVIVSMLEHHANIVPWQMVCAKKGARLKVIPVDDTGQVMLPAYGGLLGSKTKLVALTQISNAIGTVVPVQEMTRMAHAVNAKVLVDGAQSVAHMPTDVQAMDCDFFAFSGHKALGPMGIGVLYGKRELLEAMPPYQGGGGMISDVTFEKSSYKAAPYRFEAGTGSIADAVSLGTALQYLQKTGLPFIAGHERQLYAYAANELQAVKGLTLVGTSKHKASILPFTLEGFTPDQVGRALNEHGIAVRTGHHCAQPILKRFGLNSVVRASIALYNTREEIDRLVCVLDSMKQTKIYG